MDGFSSTKPANAGSWANHVRATVVLGTPLIGAQFAQAALNVTNTLILGRLGHLELGASILGWQLFFVIWMLGSGCGFAVLPVVANSIGQADLPGARRFVGSGLWVSLAYALLLMVPLAAAETIFLKLGQDRKTAELASQY